MEFKTSADWIVVGTNGNANAHLVIALVMWVLVCSHPDSVLLASLRIVLVTAVKFLKAGFAAIVTPRRRRRSRRRG